MAGGIIFAVTWTAFLGSAAYMIAKSAWVYAERVIRDDGETGLETHLPIGFGTARNSHSREGMAEPTGGPDTQQTIHGERVNNR